MTVKHFLVNYGMIGYPSYSSDVAPPYFFYSLKRRPTSKEFQDAEMKKKTT
jgi:hypothetical protein